MEIKIPFETLLAKRDQYPVLSDLIGRLFKIFFYLKTYFKAESKIVSNRCESHKVIIIYYMYIFSFFLMLRLRSFKPEAIHLTSNMQDKCLNRLQSSGSVSVFLREFLIF